jgi:hypothetical protein
MSATNSSSTVHENSGMPLYLLTFFSTYVISLYVDGIHVDGDVLAYRKVYDELRGGSFFGSFEIYSFYTGAFDPIAFVVTWVASQLAERSHFSAITNGLLITVLLVLFKSARRSFGEFIFVVPLNFYILVLLFGAERLKLAFLFAIVALVSGNAGRKFSLFLLAIFSHSQILLSFIAHQILYFHGDIREILLTHKKEVILTLTFALLLFFNLNWEQYIDKIQHYAGLAQEVVESPELSLFTIIRYSAFIIFTIYLYFASNLAQRAIWVGALFGCAVIVIGPDRLNILMVFAIVYVILLREQMPIKWLIPLVLYADAKGLAYLWDIYSGLSGFD